MKEREQRERSLLSFSSQSLITGDWHFSLVQDDGILSLVAISDFPSPSPFKRKVMLVITAGRTIG